MVVIRSDIRRGHRCFLRMDAPHQHNGTFRCPQAACCGAADVPRVRVVVPGSSSNHKQFGPSRAFQQYLCRCPFNGHLLGSFACGELLRDRAQQSFGVKAGHPTHGSSSPCTGRVERIIDLISMDDDE